VWRVLGIISWVFLVTILAVSLYIFGYILISSTPMDPQNTGIFPQVVSCVPEHPPQRHTRPNWQPTLRVQVEPARDPGRVREYHAFGCTFYYYFRYFR